MKKLTYDYVKSYIESQEYQLLSTEYSGSLQKLKTKCPEGHIYKVRWSDFKDGSRCKKCHYIKQGESQRLSKSYIKRFVSSENTKLIDIKYKPKRTRLILKCQNNHKYEISWSNFQQGYRCPVCKEIEKKNKLYEKVNNYIKKFDYILLSEKYKNKKEKLKIKCPNNHVFYMSYSNFYNGNRCPKCSASKMFSIAEKEILNLIKSIYKNKIIENDRNTILNPYTNHYLELDIYLPELNKAIEFNGDYWHSFNNTKERDKIKLNQCKNKNIDILIINESEWNNNRENQISKIVNFIHH